MKKKLKKMIFSKKTAAIAGILLLVAIGALSLFTFFTLRGLPSIDQIANRKISESTKIYDRTGQVLLYEISGDQKRTIISYDEIPQYVKDATISIEDENFFSGAAFDWKAILRALWVDIINRKIVQGGSTITQQLAKNAFLSDEQTIARKIKEFLLAIKLNRVYSKEQILGLYLNEIPYGPSAYGIESASQTYFDKSAKDLTLAQSTLLAAIPKAPTYYSPWGSHTKELFARQKLILKKMRSLGKITEQELERALAEKISFQPQLTGIKAPHFVMAVQDYLVQKYGEDVVRNGGLRVITTLDWDLEQLAEKSVAEGAKRNEDLYKGRNASLVAEDATTGQILALVGSRDYFDKSVDGNFDVATQGLRQPGSALKPFVYLRAFQKGFTPETVVFDVPTEFSQYASCPPVPDFQNENTNCFHPQNFDEVFRGPVQLKNALAQSMNVPSVKVLYLARLQDTVSLAQQFGLKTLTEPDRYGLSLVLGGGAVKLIDLVNAYGILSQDGIEHAQSLVLEVKQRNGTVLESFENQSRTVVDPQYPRMINAILSDGELRAPLFQNSFNLTTFPDYDVALKTGTSNDYHDAWTIGYTPSLVVGVWAGNNDNAPMQKHGSSILAAVPIWNSFMKEALKKQVPQAFVRPDPIEEKKPALRGEYLINNEIHSILHYVDKNNPVGADPVDPSTDPQYENWEQGVRLWTQEHPNMLQNAPLTSQALMAPKITFLSPTQGNFVTNPMEVRAQIETASLIPEVNLYWNNVKMYTWTNISPPGTTFDVSMNPDIYLSQNVLQIETTGISKTKTGIIVYSSTSR